MLGVNVFQLFKKEKVAQMKNPISNIKPPKGHGRLKIKIDIRTILLIIFLLFFIGPIFFSFDQVRQKNNLPLSQVLQDVKEKKIEEVRVAGDELQIKYKDGQTRTAIKETNQSFTELLKDAGIDPTSVRVVVEDQRFAKIWFDILGVLLPVGLMVLFFIFIFKQARGAQDSLFSFGRSRAKPFIKGKQSVTFADVAGVEEAKKELEEVVDFLKNPKKYRNIGARTPKGVLLFGPSGVGKTLLARAVAGEAGVPFFSMAGSEFMEMLVGVGASRVRDLFATAKKNAPSIIFIDEIDAIGRQRGVSGMIGGHDEREQTLNQILVEMDGFTPNDNVVVIAATNRGDLLDPALLRPGRFDRRIFLDMPDKEARYAILQVHAKGKKFAKNINWDRVATITVGFSGADLENMLNEAAILAARQNHKAVTMADIEEAATKVKLGPARKRFQTKEDKKMTAYHEAGHALVAHFLPKLDPVQRVSVVARGTSLGHTMFSPDTDRSHETRSRLLQQITAMLGGRAAEEIVFKDMSAGAANDIDIATALARKMVEDFGMSKKLGPVDWGNRYDTDEFGRIRFFEQSTASQKTLELIDKEVKKILQEAHREAVKILRSRGKLLDKIVAALLKQETLDQQAFEKIVGKKKT